MGGQGVAEFRRLAMPYRVLSFAISWCVPRLD
jgi:hypothetical protein